MNKTHCFSCNEPIHGKRLVLFNARTKNYLAVSLRIDALEEHPFEGKNHKDIFDLQILATMGYKPVNICFKCYLLVFVTA